MNTAMLVQFPRWFGENRLAFFNLLIIHQYLFPPFPFSNQTCVHEQTHRERGKFDSPFLCLVNILFQYTQGKMRYRKANSDYLSSRLKPRESLETKTKEKQWQGWCTLHLCSVASVMSDSSAHQAPLSVGFSRREYSNGLPYRLQEIFPTQGSNPHLLCLLDFRWILYPLSHLGSLYSAFTQEESQGFHFSGETGCEILSFSFPNIDMNSNKPEQITLVKREQAKSRIWRWDLNICVNTQISFESIDHFDFRFSYQ